MKYLNIKDLPAVDNVCNQILKAVEKQPNWSMAHVIMNPLESSFLHKHDDITEIYVITKGYGELVVGRESYQVAAGSVFEIFPEITHMLKNKSAGHLEHLVFAFPPFNPRDIRLLNDIKFNNKIKDFFLPDVQECFDGAKIIPYAFPLLDLSITFGWVINKSTRIKETHYHKKTSEFIYVVEGSGYMKGVEPQTLFREPIKPGNWIYIRPGERHALCNESPEHMVVVCICSPMFQMEDVHYG